jgi:hypothetical protein
MTFRGLGIWDLGIMTRVGVRKLGEIEGLKRAIEPWVRTYASGTGVRGGHRRSGDPGLWVRIKEQWADRGSEPPAPSCLCERLKLSTLCYAHAAPRQP